MYRRETDEESDRNRRSASASASGTGSGERPGAAAATRSGVTAAGRTASAVLQLWCNDVVNRSRSPESLQYLECRSARAGGWRLQNRPRALATATLLQGLTDTNVPALDGRVRERDNTHPVALTRSARHNARPGLPSVRVREWARAAGDDGNVALRNGRTIAAGRAEAHVYSVARLCSHSSPPLTSYR
ncbi:hypothetical protein J6590_024507 [Homalodisca vitripennis]|nr:hypothetical protein J6590_024507 [Homalodisca vitripennis]